MPNPLQNVPIPSASDEKGELENIPLILVIDDVLANIQIISTVLRQARYEVQKLSDPTLAIQFIKEFLPDLILLDIQMPDISGIELCQTIKSDPQISNIPIIFLTAMDDPQDKIRGLNVGGFDYITKPFHVQEVLLRVRNCLLIHDLKNAFEDKNRMLQQALEINKESLAYFQERKDTPVEHFGFSENPGLEIVLSQQRSLEVILESVHYLENSHRDHPTSLEHIDRIKTNTQDLLTRFNEFLNEISREDQRHGFES